MRFILRVLLKQGVFFWLNMNSEQEATEFGGFTLAGENPASTHGNPGLRTNPGVDVSGVGTAIRANTVARSCLFAQLLICEMFWELWAKIAEGVVF